MKRSIISIFLSFVLVFSFCTFCFSTSVSAETVVVYGDADENGDVNLLDLVALRKYLVKMDVTINETNMDLDFDGRITLLDLVVLRKGLVKLVDLSKLTPPKYIALTFDDGPNYYATPYILHRLKLAKVPATFFLIGCNINEQTLPVVEREIAEGHEIANHSYSHVRMGNMTPEQIKEQVEKTDQLIYDNFGIKTNFFRPPFLDVSYKMYQNIDQTFIAGYGTDDWDENVTADQIVEKLKANVTDGTIILLHDSQEKNADVLRKIIPYFKEEGYKFVTLSDLFKLKGVTPDHYSTYSNVLDW